jgi:sigma-E factor negative regulatory protein RseA
MENMKTQEMISALADGQLQGEAFAQGVAVAARDATALEAWQTYHLIGDVLRSRELAAGTVPAKFLSRLQTRLSQERLLSLETLEEPDSAQSVDRRVSSIVAANDASFRWKALAGFASVAAMAAIAWTLSGGSTTGPDQGQLARAQLGPVASGSDRAIMIRDARLDELLAAHRQSGGASALPMQTGFLRNAAFEGPAR